MIEKGKENVHGMMDLFMRVSGSTEKEVGQEYFLKKMEFYIKVNGEMT